MPKQMRAPKWYPTEGGKVGLTKVIKKKTSGVAKLRKSIVPGAVLILLAGRFKGKRVIFLKQLESGLLLVTGPFKINGVPLRRVNQAYVIGTSTVVDISGVDVSGISDAADEKGKHFFSRVEAEAKEDNDGAFVSADVKKPTLTEARKSMQTSVDSALIEAIGKVPYLKGYLRKKFSLEKGQYPHLMKF
mmetsp:Transcript_2150/g.3097  ORF Transcript_2150/g.3097 Transcript_2150/m.3097 type:complete len:189 (-) Transcript_2150:88-654(-)|eukprot:CAMPEP_0167757252 /NCGR_PEP_ID=MMETSP0110_2-20121227/9822_1 /TAXON_ID=629695 /ORGANISM="Gymnochlora sp., Strain CCMP2014" /LENGTH=188 /DNA_ID=CAMNT_0007643421 /DNA_START=27 /DNA_END=593 /DNA_ORIENTATION=-